MAPFKCKMCGGSLEIAANETIATCEYCGTRQTLPKIGDEQRTAIFNRGNHFRRIGEFDKAIEVYEQIVHEDNADAEAHWCCALCRFGIEYVKDPATEEYIPTCHRASFDSFLEDVDYKAALEYANVFARQQYLIDGEKIAEVQRGILAISHSEEAYDVFICYKDSDENGNRTRDSILAQDIYRQLTEEGRKVFFSRITLEDVVGKAYEPYIFAALHSARVMIVIGTRTEHLNAVWVKNEWSRFLAMMKKDRHKVLLPCYYDMDPCDMPEQLSVLQSYDMRKIGFTQDLIRGVAKVLDVQKPEVVKKIEPLLKRAFLFLEDGDWQNADEYCERVLDISPECAEAYLGKLMAQLQVRVQSDLAKCEKPFDGNAHYHKILRFADVTLRDTLTGYIDAIYRRNGETAPDVEDISAQNVHSKPLQAKPAAARKKNKMRPLMIVAMICAAIVVAVVVSSVMIPNGKYDDALALMDAGYYEAAAAAFDALGDYKDSRDKIAECEVAILEKKYQDALSLMGAGYYDAAIAAFEALDGYKDSDDKIAECRASTNQVSHQNAFSLIEETYQKANALMEAGQYEEAIAAFGLISDYKDSAEKANTLRAKLEMDVLHSAHVGDCVFYGTYEQDNDPSNGKEPIEWQVLDIKNGRALVITRYGLDMKKFHHTMDNHGSWETCQLRTWLNGEFMDIAFSSNEKIRIPTVKVTADGNPGYASYGDNDTWDQIFLLSVKEADEYFTSDGARQLKPTPYAIEMGAHVDKENGNTWWWLRTFGVSRVDSTYVYADGSISLEGKLTANTGCVIRPAMWIELGK